MKITAKINIKPNDYKPLIWHDIPEFFPEPSHEVLLLDKENKPSIQSIEYYNPLIIEEITSNYVKFCYINTP